MDILEEFAGSDLGDRRRDARLLALVSALAPDPSASFPAAAGTDGQLEATYRFLSSEKVSPNKVLAPHVAATITRASVGGTVIVAHDTTEFAFKGDRAGLGRINDGGHGFFGHFALAVSRGAARRPLGVLGVSTLVREEKPHKDHHSERRPLAQRESHRWYQMVDQVEDAVGGRVSLLHTMDSEADAYALFAHMKEHDRHFVVRLKYDRAVVARGDERPLSERLAELTGHSFRTIPVAARPASKASSKGKRNPPREARQAQLNWAAARVCFRAPTPAPRDVENLQLNVVHVYEPHPPDDCEPIDWRLVTTEPIKTPVDVEAIIDAYRARWRIEEFFKALKTGCAFEKRQLESLPALLNALAVFTPLAWQLLLLRAMAHDEADVPAAQHLRPLQLLVLERHPHTKLGQRATMRDALMAVARLGGHIRNNGEPGWIVLGRGYEKLLILEEGARLGQAM